MPGNFLLGFCNNPVGLTYSKIKRKNIHEFKKQQIFDTVAGNLKAKIKHEKQLRILVPTLNFIKKILSLFSL